MNQSRVDLPILGIDISKEKFDVALLRVGKYKHKKFSNNQEGFEQLGKWLAGHNLEQLHACMESTSVYGEALAEYLYGSGFRVSIVNPARIKGFGQSELIRSKTDKIDASLIARFCAAMKPGLWTPEPKEIRELRSLMRRVDALVEMRQQESNRLEVSDKVVKKDIEDHIEYLTNQIDSIKSQISQHIDNHPELRDKKKLLESIPGVGEATINLALAHFGDTEKFHNAKRLSSFLGIAPREYSSGNSVRGRRRMSKVGKTSLRKALFMPALVALRCNPIIIDMRRRLSEAGKPKMLIVGAAMRKMVHLIYGVLKSKMPFDPNYSLKHY
jgi:transposase